MVETVSDPVRENLRDLRQMAVGHEATVTALRTRIQTLEAEVGRLTAQLSTVEAETIEGCAKVCDEIEAECEPYDPKLNADRALAAQDCAAAIRALKTQGEGM